MDEVKEILFKVAPRVVLLSGSLLSSPWIFETIYDDEFVFKRECETGSVRLSPEALGEAILGNGIEAQVNGKDRFFIAMTKRD